MNSVQNPGDDQNPPRMRSPNRTALVRKLAGGVAYLFGEFALGAVVRVFAFFDESCRAFEKRLLGSVPELTDKVYVAFVVDGDDDDGIGMVNDLTDGLRAASH